MPFVFNDVIEFFKTLTRLYIETHCDTCHSATCPALQTTWNFWGWWGAGTDGADNLLCKKLLSPYKGPVSLV